MLAPEAFRISNETTSDGRQRVSKPRQELLELLTELSVRRGDITLSSGKKSDFYVDCKQTLLHPDGMALTGTVLVDAWQSLDLSIDAVGGPTLGADPMTCAFVLQARRRGLMIPGFFIRKEPYITPNGVLKGQKLEYLKILLGSIIGCLPTTPGPLISSIWLFPSVICQYLDSN